MYFCRSHPGDQFPVYLTSMSFIFSKKGSFLGVAIILLILFTGRAASLAQEKQPDATEAFQQVFRATQEALKHDPLIQNGIYYSYPYYNALGHPFLDTKEFGTGSVEFRGKHYDGLSINYDLFNQHIILSWESEGILQMSLLEPQFVSGFQLKGKQFIKAEYQAGEPEFFQLISETPRVSCYYSWYKERREVRDSGNRSIYSFSDQKNRRYLLLDGELYRYKSNKSILKLFPEAARDQLRFYIQENQLQVMEGSDQDMESFIVYCSGILDQTTKQGGE